MAPSNVDRIARRARYDALTWWKGLVLSIHAHLGLIVTHAVWVLLAHHHFLRHSTRIGHHRWVAGRIVLGVIMKQTDTLIQANTHTQTHLFALWMGTEVLLYTTD